MSPVEIRDVYVYEAGVAEGMRLALDVERLAAILWQIECERASGEFPHLGSKSDCRRLAELIAQVNEIVP